VLAGIAEPRTERSTCTTPLPEYRCTSRRTATPSHWGLLRHSLESVRALVPKAVILPGIFPGTIVDMGPIAFAHIDADQYDRSRIPSLPVAEIVPGGVMLFDDYKCLDGRRGSRRDVWVRLAGHTERQGLRH